MIDDPVVLLRPGDEIEMGDFFEKLIAAALRHASHHAVDDIGILFPVLPEVTHVTESLLLCLVTHGAGIHENDIRVIGLRRDREATLDEHLGDLLGVAFVHLASKGSEEDFRHGVWGFCVEEKGRNLDAFCAGNKQSSA
jgi:hypothetical protein